MQIINLMNIMINALFMDIQNNLSTVNGFLQIH